MIRRPPRYTPRRSSAASDVYKRQAGEDEELAKLVERRYKASTAYGMEIGAELAS